jgi:hypothetical protein
VYTGTLRRHTETVQGMAEGHCGTAEGHGAAGEWPRAERVPALDEYNPEAIVAAFTGVLPTRDPAAAARDSVNVGDSVNVLDSVTMRDHFRLLKKALLAWAEEGSQPVGMPAWQIFQDGAVAAVVEARQRFASGNVLVVSSGGPIAAIVADSLMAPPRIAIELNLRLRNSSVSEFASSPRRHQLHTFNSLPHLDAHADSNLWTYA